MGDSQTGKQVYHRGYPTGVWTSKPQVRLPNMEVWHWEEEPWEHLALKSSGPNRKNITELRETETPLLEGTQGLVCTRTQGKASDFIGALGQT